jgi:hypothetical protein
MHDRFLKICEAEFERYAERCAELMFEAAGELPGTANIFTAPWLELPIIGGLRFMAGHEPPELRQKVSAALIAREKFRRDAPSWTPDLPLREEDIALLENDESSRLQAVGLFARSWRYEDWDRAHPPLDAFVGGLLACKRAPDEIRDDCSLRAEFPPHRLAGLSAEELCWHSPKTRAMQRDMLARIAAFEARGAAAGIPTVPAQ